MWAKGKVVMGIKTKRIVLRHSFIHLSSALFVRMTKMTRRDWKALTLPNLSVKNPFEVPWGNRTERLFNDSDFRACEKNELISSGELHPRKIMDLANSSSDLENSLRQVAELPFILHLFLSDSNLVFFSSSYLFFPHSWGFRSAASWSPA